MSVLVLGDANVDLEIRLPPDPAPPTYANPDPRMSGGGSAANTAAGLAGLGVPCRFAGTVGDDAPGRFAVESLDEAGVDTSLVGIVADEPTVMVIVVIGDDGDRLIYVWPPRGGAHRALDVETATGAVAGSGWLHVSGIALRVSPAREAILAAMELARSEGVTVSLDLNLRLENWGWENGFRDIISDAVERSDVVLGAASDEIGALAGVDDPVEACARLAGDSRIVVARLGADGSVAHGDGHGVTMPGFEVDVFDTVGAGDAFDSGFIAARLRGDDLAESLRWGNAVAALTISHPGARSTPTPDEVERLLAR